MTHNRIKIKEGPIKELCFLTAEKYYRVYSLELHTNKFDDEPIISNPITNWKFGYTLYDSTLNIC